YLVEATGGLVPLEVEVIGREVRRGLLGQPFALADPESHVQSLGPPAGDIGLNLKDIRQRRVEGLLPFGRCSGDPHEFGAHFDPALAALAAIPAHLAYEQVLHAQLLADLLGRLRRALVLAGAVRGGDLEARERRELP